MKKRILIVLALSSLGMNVCAADIRAVADTTNGSSAFVVTDARTNQRLRVQSDGIVLVSNTVNRGYGDRTMIPIKGGDDVEIGTGADGYFEGVAVGRSANGQNSGLGVGRLADGAEYGAAVGCEANGRQYGAALGRGARAEYSGVAVGWGAWGTNSGVGIGYSAAGENLGAAMGYDSDGYWHGSALGYMAAGWNTGAAVGKQANGAREGAAMGAFSDGNFDGAAVGYGAIGHTNGAAIGRAADARYYGVAAGYQAKGQTNGSAVGRDANGQYYGAAVGRDANAWNFGAAVGVGSYGHSEGVAMGVQAQAPIGCVAVGAYANANAGNNVSIGMGVTNNVPTSTRVRGTLWLDGGTAIVYRTTFGSGAWSTKTFAIPHPLDPENKILRHYCLEGPEVWNVYAGNVQLVDGEAMVELPDYYNSLNLGGSEICNLTPWGRAMVWVAALEGNRLTIQGESDVKVSWTIKVKRNDPACQEDLKRRPAEQLRSELSEEQVRAENEVVNTEL